MTPQVNMWGDHVWQGGPNTAATDGPGGTIIAGDHPQCDSPTTGKFGYRSDCSTDTCEHRDAVTIQQADRYHFFMVVFLCPYP